MSASTKPARVTSVNVGAPRIVRWGVRNVSSAIWKTPVAGRIRVEGVNLAGDDQADRRVHGGHDKAVYAYSTEDYAWWSNELGVECGQGTFGDNLTTEGVDLQAEVVGRRWRVGTALLEIAQPREPCFKLGMRMGDAAFVDRFSEAARFGAYLRIVEPGDVGAGDAIAASEPPTHGLTLAEFAGASRDAARALLERIAAIDDVPRGWRDWARRQLVPSVTAVARDHGGEVCADYT
jgi:MOSC domain-containing protein YiiM